LECKVTKSEAKQEWIPQKIDVSKGRISMLERGGEMEEKKRKEKKREGEREDKKTYFFI
jgi:hypothetical protein